MNGTRLTIYDMMREYHYRTWGHRQLYWYEDLFYGKRLLLERFSWKMSVFPSSRGRIITMFYAGGTSGALATFFGSPFYLLKTQFQARAKTKEMATGYQVRFSDAMFDGGIFSCAEFWFSSCLWLAVANSTNTRAFTMHFAPSSSARAFSGSGGA